MFHPLLARVPSSFVRCALLLSLSLAALPAQQPTAEVPAAPNATCPIMGKKVSMPLFVDTELGRFYVCCKPCYKKILANVPAAHQTAYPVVQEVKNAVCPVSGEPIGADAVVVTLQGYRFSVCCEACVPQARQHSQVTLVKITRPTTQDVGNTTCPVSGAAVTANAFVRIGDAVVHLSAPAAVEAATKDPAGILAKARAIAAAQPPKQKHVHGKADKKPTPGEKPEAGK